MGPHQCDVEYPIDRKILSATEDSNPDLTVREGSGTA